MKNAFGQSFTESKYLAQDSKSAKRAINSKTGKAEIEREIYGQSLLQGYRFTDDIRLDGTGDLSIDFLGVEDIEPEMSMIA